jgi:hypothetical protein
MLDVLVVVLEHIDDNCHNPVFSNDEHLKLPMALDRLPTRTRVV